MSNRINPIDEIGMIQAALNFWFEDNDHIRSPFPIYIREMLRETASTKFSQWISKLSDKAEKEINDEILAEKFEEILFEAAAELVLTDDEKLTILYPFMPRIHDVINPKDDTNGESKVIGRKHVRRGDYSYLVVKLKTIDSGNEWETEFELPE